MILPLQEVQNDYRSSFVCFVCRYRRRDLGESLRMATGCALRALHQAERLEEVGSAPAIRPRCAGLHIARRYPFNRVTEGCKLAAAVVGAHRSDQAWRQLAEVLQHFWATDAFADHNRARNMHLEISRPIVLISPVDGSSRSHESTHAAATISHRSFAYGVTCSSSS